MSEIERSEVVDGEIVEEDSFAFPYEGELRSYDDFLNALIAEEQEITPHRWHQARICSMAVGRFERDLVKSLARGWGKSTQTVYDYARAYKLRGTLAAREDYDQPETLGTTRYVIASYDPDPAENLKMAEDLALNQAEHRAMTQARKAEAAEREFGKPEASTPEREGPRETMHKEDCTHCKGRGFNWVRTLELEAPDYEEDNRW